MTVVNRITSSFFDVVLTPFELLGQEIALILVSGFFGIVALLIFKHISWQAGIKGVKDRIKGHMIAIRIYQDDLGIVFSSVMKVLFRNFQYIALNFGPFVPLAIPFTLVMAQLVVRYGFDPLPVVQTEEEFNSMLPGEGVMIEVAMKSGEEAAAGDLELKLPDWLVAVSPLVRSRTDGRAFQEVVPRKGGQGVIEVLVSGRRVGTKEIVAGDEATRLMQPERVASFWWAWLWPAEDLFPNDSPVSKVSFVYPDRDLFLLPGGTLGILVVFLLSSMVFGIAVLKPLNIQI